MKTIMRMTMMTEDDDYGSDEDDVAQICRPHFETTGTSHFSPTIRNLRLVDFVSLMFTCQAFDHNWRIDTSPTKSLGKKCLRGTEKK